MPEAAEVEIVRLGLEKALLDDASSDINRIEIFDPKLENEAFNDWNKRIKAFRRHGKLLGIEFEDESLIAIHLRLAGRLVIGPDSKPRAVLHFRKTADKKKQVGVISFADTRRFATMKLIEAKDFQKNQGPDLLHGNLDLWTPPDSKRAVKTVMLDQTEIAGIGNYLIDESLWEQKVLPSKPFNKITKEQAKDIAYTARKVAQGALKAGGVSIRDYVSADGSSGEFQDSLKCYGRAGQPCVRCGKKLSKTKVGGRGTTYCSFCQS